MTSDTPPNGTPWFQKPDDFKRMRSRLTAAGFEDVQVLQTIGARDSASLKETDMAPLLRRTAGGGPLNVFIRLFLMETACHVGAVEQAVAPMDLQTWIDAGLIRTDGNMAQATIKLLPFQGLLMAFDRRDMLDGPSRRWYVMGIGASTLTLANLTIRRQVQRTLDLGTGCGIHAFLAAPHSRRVFAVDRNPRAVRIAAFNAALNDLPHVECREGDLFGPVQDQTFDLMVANPPFVISPETAYIYRDGGLPGDAMARKIAREAPLFLTEGGYCQMLCNWIEPSDCDWKDRLRGWFENTGCDAWVLRSETRDAETYATTWIRHTERAETKDYIERFGRWMTYYEKNHIDAIGAGLVVLRKSSNKARHWFHAYDESPKMSGPCGDDIEHKFRSTDFLESHPTDASLLNAVFKSSPHVRLDRQSVPSDDGWIDESFRLHLNQGLAHSTAIDPFVANLVIKCDGKTPLRLSMDQMAAAIGKNPVDIQSSLCYIVRKLVEDGYLLPIPEGVR